MTLSEILGRDVLIEWHEAVALVRDIVERTAEVARGKVPELHQVELQGWGKIQLLGGATVPDPVQRITQLLQALLTRAETPVQLRLLMAQPHDSLQTYSEALAFFERPDRAPILQALYNRASAAPPLRNPDLLAAAPMPSTLHLTDAAGREKDSKAAFRRGKVVYALGALAVIVALAAAALYAARANASPKAGSTDLTSKITEGVAGVTAAVGSAVSTIGARVGLGGAEAAPAEQVEAAKTLDPPAAAKRQRRGVEPPKITTPVLQRMAMTAFDLGSPQTEPPVTTDSVTVVAQPHAEEDGVAADAVFTASSEDVLPPVGIRPQLPKELPPGVRQEDLSRIELLILPDGTVESVKLLGTPRSVHEAMLLSAVKNWRFHPAMKGDTPVKYRKTIWVAR